MTKRTTPASAISRSVFTSMPITAAAAWAVMMARSANAWRSRCSVKSPTGASSAIANSIHERRRALADLSEEAKLVVGQLAGEVHQDGLAAGALPVTRDAGTGQRRLGQPDDSGVQSNCPCAGVAFASIQACTSRATSTYSAEGRLLISWPGW